MTTTFVKNHRQAPRKVRLVADLVRGKKVSHALTVLAYLNKKAAEPIRTALESAAANANNNLHIPKEKLFIKDIRVDEGTTLKRFAPRARGSAARIRKRTSHIQVTLDTRADGLSTLKAHAVEPSAETHQFGEMHNEHTE